MEYISTYAYCSSDYYYVLHIFGLYLAKKAENSLLLVVHTGWEEGDI